MNIIMVTTLTDVYAPTAQPSAICVHEHEDDHVTYASHMSQAAPRVWSRDGVAWVEARTRKRIISQRLIAARTDMGGCH